MCTKYTNSHCIGDKLFATAHVPLYLYPFLNTVSKNRPFEYLRLTSLGVIGALVKLDDSDVINFLLQTEIIPLCLRIMETGSELSKTVSFWSWSIFVAELACHIVWFCFKLGGDFHSAENFARWDGLELYLRNSRALLRCRSPLSITQITSKIFFV